MKNIVIIFKEAFFFKLLNIEWVWGSTIKKIKGSPSVKSGREALGCREIKLTSSRKSKEMAK